MTTGDRVIAGPNSSTPQPGTIVELVNGYAHVVYDPARSGRPWSSSSGAWITDGWHHPDDLVDGGEQR